LKTFFLCIVLLIAFSLENVNAGGFQLNEHGAKPMGMGGAFTAIANDASAIYWNGAGLTWNAGPPGWTRPRRDRGVVLPRRQ